MIRGVTCVEECSQTAFNRIHTYETRFHHFECRAGTIFFIRTGTVSDVPLVWFKRVEELPHRVRGYIEGTLSVLLLVGESFACIKQDCFPAFHGLDGLFCSQTRNVCF